MSGTIFALASGTGRGAVAVLRISGPATHDLLTALTRRAPPPPRRASLRRLVDTRGALLDQALVLWMPGPGSYTGEDSAELHVHGGPAVRDAVAMALVENGARPAESGEFSRRAFLSGRIDLTEAEAVADLIDAETQAQRVQALRQMDGALKQLIADWAARLTLLLAREEALIDFPEDIAGSHGAAASQDDGKLHALIVELSEQLDDNRAGERLREGLRFVISGPPNAGKSSLINVLSGRDAAIVASSPGTTRDIIDVRTIFGGVPVVLTDTAGLRESSDPVEAEGIRRARAVLNEADLILHLTQAHTLASSHQADLPEICQVIEITSKIDLAPALPDTFGVSVHTGAGLPELRALLNETARRLTQRAGSPPLTRARHRAACREALANLQDAVAAADTEFKAEALRLALRALGRISGRISVEHVLDGVFSQFCIGK